MSIEVIESRSASQSFISVTATISLAASDTRAREASSKKNAHVETAVRPWREGEIFTTQTRALVARMRAEDPNQLGFCGRVEGARLVQGKNPFFPFLSFSHSLSLTLSLHFTARNRISHSHTHTHMGTAVRASV